MFGYLNRVLWRLWYWFISFRRPKRPRRLRWSFDMRTAKVKLTWRPSTSPDVLIQVLSIRINDEVATNYALYAETDVFEFYADENAHISVELIAYNGIRDSRPAILEFTIPNLERPNAPTDLGWQIVAVEEKPEY